MQTLNPIIIKVLDKWIFFSIFLQIIAPSPYILIKDSKQKKAFKSSNNFFLNFSQKDQMLMMNDNTTSKAVDFYINIIFRFNILDEGKDSPAY
jgi:hypothetical protein